MSFIGRLSALIPFFFFFNDTATTEIYTLSLHDALPIYARDGGVDADHPPAAVGERAARVTRVERRVGLDDVLDDAAGRAGARRQRAAERAHHPRRHRAGEAERVADRDDQLADAQPVGIAELGGR